MATADIDSISDLREKYTFSPNVLLLSFPDDNPTKIKQSHTSPTVKFHPHQPEKRQTRPQTARLHTDRSNIRESVVLPYNWQRRAERIPPITPAPDVIYRYSCMEEPKRKKSAPMSRSSLSSSRPTSARRQHSQQSLIREQASSPSSYDRPNSPQRQYPEQFRSVYEYILYSIREIQHRRNLKQPHFPTCIKRPQNDDVVLQRALSAKKYPATTNGISICKHDLLNTEKLINCIHQPIEQVHGSRTTTPNELSS